MKVERRRTTKKTRFQKFSAREFQRRHSATPLFIATKRNRAFTIGPGCVIPYATDATPSSSNPTPQRWGEGGTTKTPGKIRMVPSSQDTRDKAGGQVNGIPQDFAILTTLPRSSRPLLMFLLAPKFEYKLIKESITHHRIQHGND